MKRTIFIITGLLFLIAASIYLFTPSQINITQTTINEVSELNTSRFLLYEKNWPRWWPGQKSAIDSKLFNYKGTNYHFENSTNSGVTLVIMDAGADLKSQIIFIVEDNLKVRITWTAQLHSGSNIIKRIEQYRHAKKVSQDMATILQHFKTFLENERNVYGFHIRLSKVKDPVMLATSDIVDKYPDMQIIDPMIKRLRRQIKDQNGKETNYPMLNINQVSKNQYQVMVAIPTDKELKPAANIFVNKMVLGNILEADVKGGRGTINDAFNELRNFSKDYHFTSPAMPFESMVTDRSIEKDTSKWITKIYYPIY
ncbi:MAG TPA: hypothetical protein VK668_15225 [Mucilaginibacter sp.]|nr:hypothetical protein [Mucilaginibacter sp.]